MLNVGNFDGNSLCYVTVAVRSASMPLTDVAIRKTRPETKAIKLVDAGGL